MRMYMRYPFLSFVTVCELENGPLEISWAFPWKHNFPMVARGLGLNKQPEMGGTQISDRQCCRSMVSAGRVPSCPELLHAITQFSPAETVHYKKNEWIEYTKKTMWRYVYIYIYIYIYIMNLNDIYALDLPYFRAQPPGLPSFRALTCHGSPIGSPNFGGPSTAAQRIPVLWHAEFGDHHPSPGEGYSVAVLQMMAGANSMATQ